MTIYYDDIQLSHATGFSRDLQIQARMRGAVVARVIPVLFVLDI